jgi:hypothetical protein
MSTRLVATIAALLTVVAAAGAGTANAATGDALVGDAAGAVLADPASAAALASATAPVSSGSLSWVASPSEAGAAAGAAGASTSGTPLSSQAAGATAAPDSLVSLPVTWCWANAAWHEWGTWPYEQRITDTTYWCASYGQSITYRTTSVKGTGTFCGTGWTASALISGGIGYPWFTMRSSAGFACPTVIPWITLHENRWEDVNRTDTGGTHEVASG